MLSNLLISARPPMLMAVPRKGIQQEDIVYVLITWDILSDPTTVFTDGNARSSTTDFYRGLEHLDKVDFTAAGARYWGDKGADFKRKKQAEALRFNQVLLDEISGFAVYNTVAREKLESMLSNYSVSKKIFLAPEYYY
jgi:hypothetical protein